MRPIFLIGMPGSGKTTLGRAYAKAEGLDFIDLDKYIESRFRRSVSDIFREKGETEFRRLEAVMLREIGEMADTVIACGGGTPCHSGNMEYMNANGITVHLLASRQRLHERLKAARSRRPHIAPLSDEEIYGYIDSTLEARLPFYSLAHHGFPSDLLESRSQIDRAIADLSSTLLTFNP